jgi:hypothetical protein
MQDIFEGKKHENKKIDTWQDKTARARPLIRLAFLEFLESYSLADTLSPWI